MAHAKSSLGLVFCMGEVRLVTAGAYGWAMVATGRGSDIATAQKNANALASRVLIPNIRYRRDIGERLINGEFALVEAWAC